MKTHFQQFGLPNRRESRSPGRRKLGVILVAAAIFGAYSPSQAAPLLLGLRGLGASAGATGVRAAGSAAARGTALRGAPTQSSNAARAGGISRFANQARGYGSPTPGGGYSDQSGFDSQSADGNYYPQNLRSYQPPAPRYEPRRVFVGQVCVRQYLGMVCVGHSWDPCRRCWVEHLRPNYQDVWQDRYEVRMVRVR